MEASPLVTAVVTTCKRKTEIVERALKSVAGQTYKNLEIILVNDFPEDKALSKELEALCGSFERKVIYAPVKRNSGSNAARNLGAALSNGVFIAFLDDDDEWLPEKIELQAEKMSDESVGIVYSNIWIDSEKTHTKSLRFNMESPEGDLYSSLFHDNIIGSTSFPLIRKRAFDEVGGFDETVPALQDMELWLRITRKYKAVYINKPLGVYYFTAGDRISAHPERRISGYEKIYEQHREFLLNHKSERAAFDLQGVTLYVNNRSFRHALKLWAEAVKLKPLSLKNNIYCAVKIVVRFFIKPKIV